MEDGEEADMADQADDEGDGVEDDEDGQDEDAILSSRMWWMLDWRLSLRVGGKGLTRCCDSELL